MPGRRQRAGVPRRKRVWSRTAIDIIGITNAAPAQVDLLGVVKVTMGGAWPLGCTAGPVILSGLTVRTSVLSEVTPTIVIGVRVASNAIEAVDQDPADSTATMLDWMLWSGFPASGVDDTNLVIGDGPSGAFRTGSMRKLEELNETLFLVAGTADVGTYNVRGWASTLLLLP